MTGAALDAQLFLSLVLLVRSCRGLSRARAKRVQERDFLDGGEGKLGSDGV